jgi:NADPH:quinone reductase-like Zn-dependent oxidoreductase
MKAMAQDSFAADQPLRLVDLPTPEPRAGEVRVRVHAAGVNPIDWKLRTGAYRLAARLLAPPAPYVPGVDFAGIVDAVGDGVTHFRPGDRVVGGVDFRRKQRGSFADTVLVRDDQLASVPDGLDLQIAGALPVAGVTAHLCVAEAGRVREGQRALILGASGGVGQLAVQFVRMLGGRAIGVCSTRNIELVRSLGAEAVIDYTQGDALAQAKAYAPFQAVIDCVGGHRPAACRALLGPGGRHVMIAAATLGERLAPMLPPFHSKSVFGMPSGARLRPVLDAVAGGAVKVNIAGALPLTAAEDALAQSQAGRLTGKLVLLPEV